MKGSFNLKSTLKKKNSITTATGTTNNNLQKQSYNSGIYSSTNKRDRLLQLKQKLEKQKQMMRKSGKRFKQTGTTNTVEIQTFQLQLKPQRSLQRVQSGKNSTSVNTGVGNQKLSSKEIGFGSKKNLFLKKTKYNQVTFIASKTQTTKSPNQMSTQQQKAEYQSKKQAINLMELSTVLLQQKNPSTSKEKAQKQNLMRSSNAFQKQIKEQKKRNMKIQRFLTDVGLSSFTQQFINMGYDEIDTLIEVTVQDLNHMMMRAHQQDGLLQAIKKYKQQNQIQEEKQKPLVNKPSTIKTSIGFRPKSALTTQPSSPQNSRVKTQHRLQQNLSQYSKLSQLLKTDMSQSTLMKKSSFFYTVGSNDWSLQSQVRRACSGCFKITPSSQLCRVGECYYCQKCDTSSIDTQIHLNDSMIRFYTKEQHKN